ncbi:hypothetical protein [Alkalibacillus aidingensis]|nr:hypothetical protein [Alkalibacillus aidingensis]
MSRELVAKTVMMPFYLTIWDRVDAFPLIRAWLFNGLTPCRRISVN